MQFEYKLVNLTPHDITVVSDKGEEIVKLEKSSDPLRVGMERVKEDYIEYWDADKTGSIPVNNVFLNLEGVVLPPERDGVLYVVSRVVAESFPDRNDFIIPDETVRDDEGKIKGCKSFARVSKPSLLKINK